MEYHKADILISGAGPIGLLIAHCLSRNRLTTYVAEEHLKLSLLTHARAAMIAPRSLEILEQLDLADRLRQIRFVVRG